MRPTSGTSLLLPVLLATLPAAPMAAQQAPTSWTITIDCASGQSINEALAQTAPLLTVEVRGECVENVVVRRDGVTLRGADPQRDGIRSPGSLLDEAVVLIRDASRVTLANLRISGGVRDGLRVLNSTEGIVVENSRFEGNAIWGAALSDSTVAFVESSFTGNAGEVGESIGGGLIAARGSDAACTRCVIELNSQSGLNLGAVAFSGSTLRLIESRVAGDTAVLAQSYARALIESTEMIGATWAFQANSYGTVEVSGGTLSGPFLAKSYSTIELLGATQVLNQLQNFVTESSKLVADRLAANQLETTLAGLTLVADYSTGRLANGTAVEELACALGGDVTCDATVLKPSVLGCPSCRR